MYIVIIDIAIEACPNIAELNNVKESFRKYKSNVDDLKRKIYNKDGYYRSHFGDMVREMNSAVSEFNDTFIDLLVTSLETPDAKFDENIISSFKSFISTISKVSNSIILGLMTLIVFAYLILI